MKNSFIYHCQFCKCEVERSRPKQDRKYTCFVCKKSNNRVKRKKK